MCMRGMFVLPMVLLVAGCSSDSLEPETQGTPDTSDAVVSADTGAPQDALGSPETTSSEDSSSDDTMGPADAMALDDGVDIEEDTTSIEPVAWTSVPLGDDGVISDLVAISTHEAYAVGGSRVLYFNGTVWVGFGDLGDVVLNGVWAGPDSVVVVGEAGFIARRSKASTSWVIEDSGTLQHLHGIFGRDEQDVWAVGNEGTILHYTGPESGWALEDQTSNIDLYGVWANPETSGPEGVVTCGSGGRLILYYGGQWSTSHVAPGDVTLRSLYGYEDKLFAVGTEGTITVRQTETGSWVGQPSNMTSDNDLFAVAASGDNDIFAFGAKGSVLKWLGTSWQTIFVDAQTYAASDYIAAAWAKGVDGSPGRWLVLSDQGGGIASEDAESWVDLVTQPQDGLTALAQDADGQLWAAGRDGLLVMRQGEAWSAIPTSIQRDIYGLAHHTDGTIWMVGQTGLVLSRSPDGTLTEHAVPAFTDLLTVHIDGDTVIIGGKGGALIRRQADDGAFVPWVLGITQDIRAIEQSEDGHLWLAGGFGALYRVDADDSSVKIATGISSSLNALTATPDRMIAAGDGGIILEIGADDEVTRLYERSGLFLYGVASTGQTTVAVGWSGTAVVLSGDTAFEEDTGTTQILEAVWSNGDEAVAVGRAGSVFMRQEAP